MDSTPVQPPSVRTRRGIRWLVLICLLPVLVCITWWAGSAVYHQQTFRPKGKILFACTTDYNEREAGLCEVNADGSGYMQFTLPYYHFVSPAWSPDGQSIAFLDGYALSVVGADGSGMADLTDQFGRVEDPVWSPDGKMLAFTKYDAAGKAQGIYTVRPDGSGLTKRSSFGTAPVWSPDGKRIAFTNAPDGIYLVDVASGNQTLIAGGISANSLAWSPNGSQLAFSVYRYSNTYAGGNIIGLWLMNIDGSNTKHLQGEFSSPAWSPDGTKIAFSCGYVLCTVNSDGSGQRQLSQYTLLGLISSVGTFAWSPDGQYIVYGYSDNFCPGCGVPNSQLWIMKADGSEQTKLTDGKYDWKPVWRAGP